MRSARLVSATCVGLLVLFSGCYHYGHFGPGGYPPISPGGYPPPTMTPVPSTPYVPYNSQGVSPTPITPNGSSVPQWQPPPGNLLPGDPNAAPPYDSTPGNKPVPNPTDGEQPFGTPPGAGLPPANGASNVSGSGIELQPIEFGAAAPPSAVAAHADPFAVPARSVSSGAALTERPGGAMTRPHPFLHDSQNFEWLRGVLSYDPHDQRWIIMYDDNPTASDRYGGSLTLSDHPLLKRLKPDDVVLVEGRVATDAIDKDGKPLYQVDKLIPLQPKRR